GDSRRLVRGAVPRDVAAAGSPGAHAGAPMAMGSGMSGSSLLMSGVTLSRGGRTIVSRISMDARAGELIVLRRVSGSGKTTIPRQLSGGEAQRVAIARALAVDPPVLLMDEPMASLDPSRRAELGAQLRRLTDAGRTLMVTSHDEAFSNQFATRIVTIENGQL